MRAFLEHPLESWLWWSWVDLEGQSGLSNKSKYQRERWHLQALHKPEVLDELAMGMVRRLAEVHPSARVQIASVWVDHTPQAVTTYVESPADKSNRQVKCELADLLVVSAVSTNGRPVKLEDMKALLLQAKVTDVQAELDVAAQKSSSGRERNLLECCNGPISLWTGTGLVSTLGTSKMGARSSAGSCLGNYDLQTNNATPGLRKYSRYLTIPREAKLPVTPAYQTLWPTSRKVCTGNSYSFTDLLYGMMSPQNRNDIGCPVAGPDVPADWTRLISDLTRNYHKSVVNRFNKKPVRRLIE